MSPHTPSTLTHPQGMALVSLARHTLAHALSIPWQETDKEDDTFHRHQATFVTLRHRGQLRGCIGALLPTTTLWESVKRNTLSAAFNDHRFDPVTPKEFYDIHIEVSLLSPLTPLHFDAPDQLLTALDMAPEGVLIKKGASSATFLPQVWKELPRPEIFLSQLCLKAGLSHTAWQDPGLEVSTYGVQYFQEA